jgi:hypothetical protein
MRRAQKSILTEYEGVRIMDLVMPTILVLVLSA